MSSDSKPLPDISILIFSLREQKVIIDADLARIYGVSTKALNQSIKRNAERFPEDFMFKLTWDEAQQWHSLRSQTVTLKRGYHLKYLPHAFTEHGALMAANVLTSPRAVEMSVYVIRAFVQMRRELSTTEALGHRLAQIEKTLFEQGVALRDIYTKIRPLLIPPPEPKRREIGFHTKPGADSVARGEETASAAQRDTPGASEKQNRRGKRMKWSMHPMFYQKIDFGAGFSNSIRLNMLIRTYLRGMTNGSF